MIAAALTWEEAIVGAVSVAMLGLIIIVVVWQIFRTGQTAMRRQGSGQELERLRREVDQLRAELGRAEPRPEREEQR